MKRVHVEPGLASLECIDLPRVPAIAVNGTEE